MLTRKHFRLVASIISKISNLPERERQALDAADKFVRENPRFNRKLFLEACECPCATLNTYLTETDLELAS